MTKTYLKATTQKSYYKKAVIFEDENYIVLRSYNTDVIAIDKTTHQKPCVIRLWNGWSATTQKHINDFLTQYGFYTYTKKEWLALPCINSEDTYNIYMSNGFFTHKCPALLTEQECEKEIGKIKSTRPSLYVWYD